MKYDNMYYDIAYRVGLESQDPKYKVGCVLVSDGVIAEGFNGTLTGLPNKTRDDEGKTHPYVVHAEQNAIAKAARKGNATEGATAYITHAPCRDCARLLHQAGITRIVYGLDFKDTAGLDMLRQAGVTIDRI